jgi:RNA-directed DNA polymerase
MGPSEVQIPAESPTTDTALDRSPLRVDNHACSLIGGSYRDTAEQWEPDEARASRPVLRARGGEIPRVTHLVVGFEHEDDARRFLDAMRERFDAFALSLRPEKTRLIEFGRHAADGRALRGLSRPETFTFLGFTYICGRSRRGHFQLQRKTRRDRQRAKLQDIKAELRRRMHQPIPVQGSWLKQVVTGHFAYYAVPTNARALSAFRHYVTDLWRRTLRRRSQKDGFTRARMTKLAAGWLPEPRVLHPWPDQRSPSNTRGRSRMPESGPSGSVRGASSNGRPYREPGQN